MPPTDNNSNSTLSLISGDVIAEGDLMTKNDNHLYKKVLTLLPNLETVKPNSTFQIVKDNNDRATVMIRGFNDNPAEKIGVEIMRMEPAKIVKDDNGIETVISPSIRHAPTIIFEFNKQNEHVQAYAIYDDRPGREYGKVKLEINDQKEYVETGADEDLNQKLDEYVQEFLDTGFNLA